MAKFKFGDPQTVVAVVRVSDVRQELSPEAQAHAIEQYCQARGLTLAAVFIERVTSVTPLTERLGLQDALRALRDLNAGILMFLNRDRISRDVVITKLIEREAIKAGAAVTTVSGLNGTTPQDEMLKTIMDAVAQHEREQLIARTRAALAVKKRRGEYIGGLPYGYRWQGKALVPHPEEQQVIQEVRALRQAGMPLRTICKTLAHVSRRGTPFTKTQIVRMLQSPHDPAQEACT